MPHLAAIALTLATLSASPGAAQTTGSSPTGLWYGVGLGAGALRFTCDLCADTRDRGASVTAMIGAWATPAVRVALEGGGWTLDDGGDRETLWRAGLTGFVHPRPGSGLHLLAGLSWVGYGVDEISYDSGALSVGIGWDFPFVPGWTIGNAVRVDAASFGSFRNGDDRVAEDVGLSVVRFEVVLRRR